MLRAGGITLRICQYLDYMVFNVRLTDEWRIATDLKGTGCGLVGVLPSRLWKGTEENKEKMQYSRCPCEDSNHYRNHIGVTDVLQRPSSKFKNYKVL
jgi:hypothetical protein